MTQEFIIYDTEFWTDEGVMARSWGGIFDHPPVTIQIGALKIRADENFSIIDQLLLYVKPRDAFGKQLPLTPYFTDLTHISAAQIETKGLELAEAMQQFQNFVGGLNCYSYGRDDLCSLAQSCYLADCPMPIKATQGRDIRRVFHQSHVPEAVINSHSSGTISQYFGISLEQHHVHDALDDARSIWAALKVLKKNNQLILPELKDKQQECISA